MRLFFIIILKLHLIFIILNVNSQYLQQITQLSPFHHLIPQNTDVEIVFACQLSYCLTPRAYLSDRQRIIKLKQDKMHFSKFLSVSQFRENSQLIAQKLSRPPPTESQYHIEGDDKDAGTYHIRVQNAYLSPNNVRSQQVLLPRPLSPHAPTQKFVKSNPQTPKARSGNIPISFQEETGHLRTMLAARKNMDNNIAINIRPSEQMKNPIRERLAVPTPPKLAQRARKASCQLDTLHLPKYEAKKLSPQTNTVSPHKNIQILMPKFPKPMTLKQVNDNQLSSNSNKYLESTGISENMSRSQIFSPMTHDKKTLDSSCIKKVPSFLSSPKNTIKKHSQSQKTYAIQNFIIFKQLGNGTFGRVVLARQKRSKSICAIKILSKRAIKQDGMIQQLLREIKIQMYLNHPNIIKVYGFFDDLLHFYIIMQSALDGQLSDLLHNSQKIVHEPQCSIWFYQICNAVSALHSSSIIHRDLKPENIMLHEGVIKISDFGWSVIRGSTLRSTFCGTPLYLCPQMLLGDEYDESIDIWTVGMVLYEMLYKENPFGITTRQELSKILDSPIHFPENASGTPSAREVIRHCLSKRSVDRPNIRELLLFEYTLSGQTADEYRK